MSDQTIPTSEILNRAADLIEERGWESGSGWDPSGGPLCLEGAIGAAMGVKDEMAAQMIQCPASDAVRAYIADQNLSDKPLYMWNDALMHGLEPDGTITHRWPGGSRESAEQFARDKVIATLRATAAIEQARETAPAEVSA